MSVAVEGDRDRRVAQVGAQRLGVESGVDRDAGEGVTTLVEAERFQFGVLSALSNAAAKDRGIRRPVRVLGAGEEQAPAGMVEEDEVVSEDVRQLVDDRDLAGLARLRYVWVQECRALVARNRSEVNPGTSPTWPHSRYFPYAEINSHDWIGSHSAAAGETKSKGKQSIERHIVDSPYMAIPKSGGRCEPPRKEVVIAYMGLA